MDRALSTKADGTLAALAATMTLDDLPPSSTKRWVTRRKAQVVAAVRGGLLTMDQARSRYALSDEEFQEWQRGLERFGVSGLRITYAGTRKRALRHENENTRPQS